MVAVVMRMWLFPHKPAARDDKFSWFFSITGAGVRAKVCKTSTSEIHAASMQRFKAGRGHTVQYLQFRVEHHRPNISQHDLHCASCGLDDSTIVQAYSQLSRVALVHTV